MYTITAKCFLLATVILTSYEFDVENLKKSKKSLVEIKCKGCLNVDIMVVWMLS